MTLLLAIVVGIHSAPACSAQTAEDEYAAVAKALPGAVTSVESGGFWGDHGHYRLVIIQAGHEHVYSKTYAQWLTEADGDVTVQKSAPVGELTDQLPFVVGNPTFVFPSSSKSKGVFEVQLTDRTTLKSSRARIRMGDPGEVSVDLPQDEGGDRNTEAEPAETTVPSRAAGE